MLPKGSPASLGCQGWGPVSGCRGGGSPSSQEDAVGRMGMVGGASESGDGGSGSVESESGALAPTVEVARDTRAKNGMDEASKMSGGCERSHCSCEGQTLGKVSLAHKQSRSTLGGSAARFCVGTR